MILYSILQVTREISLLPELNHLKTAVKKYVTEKGGSDNMTILRVTVDGRSYPVLSSNENYVTLLDTRTGKIFSRGLSQVRVPEKICQTYDRDLERYADGC